MELHSGQSVRLWTDLWHPLGRLIEVVGEIGTQKLGIARTALVCDVRNEGHWRFRRFRDRHMKDLIQAIENNRLEEDQLGQEVVLWRRNDTEFGKGFTTSETWQKIRIHSPAVPWSKVVWFPLGVPRFAFITWLAIRDRLSTGDCMRTWGHVQGCLFCGEPNESRDHLFFACPYTYTLWIEVIGTLLGRPPDPDWERTLVHLTTHGFDRLVYILLRLTFQTTIYMIWSERNDRKHLKKPRQVTQLAKLIGETVRNRISSVKYSEKPRLRGLMQLWFSTHT
ncbi:hypothetical protein Bca52824_081855 [Brassica carinata]|uniref:Reverse transcriptase zinc-binding domain-containing protein n=1 Tax=Brassica carinata TaxID=52824 RepID=A0A8X7PFX6_BRACI|nr:hypothetical protein Bca52824_081855 [Brassica carinata]